MLNLVCCVLSCEGQHAGAGSLSYIVHIDCCGLLTIVIKNVIIIIRSGSANRLFYVVLNAIAVMYSVRL